MKKLILLAILASTIVACNQATENNTEEVGGTSDTTASISGRYGDTTWSIDEAFDAASLEFLLANSDSLEAVVKGPISAVCQAKGCWMKMDVAGNDMLVRFTDYEYFVPKNASGHQATVKGWMYKDSISVADQKELIMDSDKTAEEKEAAIAQISGPKVKLSFMADGVIIE